MSTANKLTYLNGTKQAIKQAINEDFEVVYNNTTFREYADEISSNNAKYKDLIPKVNVNATNTLDISNSSGLDKALVTQYGNTYQETTTGKNKLSPNLKPNGDRGIIGTYNNSTGEITITGTPTAAFSNIGDRVDFATPLPAGTYTLSTEKVENVRIGLHLYKSGGDINNYAIALGNKELQITVTDEITGYYLYIYGLDSTKQYNQSFKAMFESGSSATDWEKNTGGNPAPNPDYPQEIVNISGKSTLKDVGKNLFDKSKVTIGNRIDPQGVPFIDSKYSLSDYIVVEPNTTYIRNLTPSIYQCVAFYKKDKTFISRNTSYEYFTTSNDTYYVRISMLNENVDTTQLEKGSTLTDYEPYKEQSFDLDLPFELCKKEDYKNKIYPLNGKWYFEKNIKKILLDGSESLVYGYSQVLDKVVRIDVRNILINSKALSSNKMLCDKFISVYSDNSDYEHCRNLDSSYIDTVSFYINKSRLSDISSSEKIMESFIELLQNNHIIIEYLLDSAETIEITESNYPTLYNQLNNIKLFEGVNHITMTNESGLDVEFDIEYYKDWKLD